MGVFYASCVIIVTMFPGARPVTADTVSWSPVVIVGTGLICLLTWKCYGGSQHPTRLQPSCNFFVMFHC